MAFSGMFQELWGELAYREFLARADLANLCNRSYDGTIRRRGDTVHVNFFNPASLTVQTSWESGNADTDFGDVVTITVDHEASVQVKIMSIDSLRTNADLGGETAFAMAAALANDVDKHILLTASGEGGTQLAITGYDSLVDARAEITGAGYPAGPNDLWYAATSTQYKALLKDDDVNRATVTDSDQVSSGQVRRIAGVNVFEQAVDSGRGVLFHRNALCYVSQTALDFEEDSLLGGEKKRGNILGAYILGKAKVLSSNGVVPIKNS